ncbi:MAG TPA: zf-HC2 domain-containing protein [Pyrinomonadaceae bacterium]|nr:zf-HC2 domain-containing protein [Pyrinomonadaceae bacterium]
MFARHVTKELSAYCHHELANDETRRVREHLSQCANCRTELAEIKRGITSANRLAQIPAPPELWSAIEASLTAGGEVREQADRGIHRFFLPRLASPILVASLLMAFGCGAVWLWRTSRRETQQAGPAVAAWSVTRVAGRPRFGAQEGAADDRLAVGEWLETDRESRARIKVADIGRVEVDPGTRVRLVETQADEHRLALERGKIHALILAPPRLFFVDTPSGVAVDYGCAYTLEVDGAGRSLLRVTAGQVALELNGRQAMVPARYSCETRPGVGPGTPYFDESSSSFREHLAKLDFERGGDASLKIVLAEARESDALSLWYLLPRVSPAERPLVFDRLGALVRPPQAVTREGILGLDEGMLDLWKEKIEIESW